MKTLFTREELAARWGYNKSSIQRLEEEGVIHRVKGLVGCKYSLKEIEEIENLGRSDFEEVNFIKYQKLENEKEFWKMEYLKLRNAISQSANDLVKVLSEGGLVNEN